MKDQTKAYLYAIAAVIIWSTVASAFKVSLRYVDHIQLLFYSCLVTVIVLGAVLVYQKKLELIKKQTPRQLIRSALMGAVNPFIYYIVLFLAYTELPAQEAQPLNYTWPIWLVLLSIPLLKQKVKPMALVAILISFVGVVWIAFRGDFSEIEFANLKGVLLGLGSAVIWATFWVFNKKDKRDEVVKLFLNFSFGLVFITLALFLLSEPIIPKTNGLMGVAYVGMFEMGVTFLIWSSALKLTKDTAKISNLIYLSPFLSLVVIYFVVGEKIEPSTIVGLALIITGIVIQQYVNKEKGRT